MPMQSINNYGRSKPPHHLPSDEVIMSSRDKIKGDPIHGENATVRDCMTWEYDDNTARVTNRYDSPPRRTYDDRPRDGPMLTDRSARGGGQYSDVNYRALPRKAEIGRSRNWELYKDDPPPAWMKPKPTEGGVAEIMYGWGNNAKKTNMEWEPTPREVDKHGNRKVKKVRHIDQGDDDVYMDELMSHRFMREQEERRKREMEDLKQQNDAARRNRYTAKDNRASVLRTEANCFEAEKEDPMSLWKMPKFTKDAKHKINCHNCKDCKGRQKPSDDWTNDHPKPSFRGGCQGCDGRSPGRCGPMSEFNHDIQEAPGCGCAEREGCGCADRKYNKEGCGCSDHRSRDPRMTRDHKLSRDDDYARQWNPENNVPVAM